MSSEQMQGIVRAHWRDVVYLVTLLIALVLGYSQLTTRADVLEIVKGSGNPWVVQEPLVMRVVGRYDEDMKMLQTGISDIKISLATITLSCRNEVR